MQCIANVFPPKNIVYELFSILIFLGVIQNYANIFDGIKNYVKIINSSI